VNAAGILSPEGVRAAIHMRQRNGISVLGDELAIYLGLFLAIRSASRRRTR
jgi:hypothetical protein